MCEGKDEQNDRAPDDVRTSYTEKLVDLTWKYIMSSPEAQQEFVDEYNRIMKHAPEAITFLYEHAKDARWDILERAMQVMESGFRSKLSG